MRALIGNQRHNFGAGQRFCHAPTFSGSRAAALHLGQAATVAFRRYASQAAALCTGVWRKSNVGKFPLRQLRWSPDDALRVVMCGADDEDCTRQHDRMDRTPSCSIFVTSLAVPRPFGPTEAFTRYRSISVCWSASFLFRFLFCSISHNHANPAATIIITIKMASSIIGPVLTYCSPTYASGSNAWAASSHA